MKYREKQIRWAGQHYTVRQYPEAPLAPAFVTVAGGRLEIVDRGDRQHTGRWFVRWRKAPRSLEYAYASAATMQGAASKLERELLKTFREYGATLGYDVRD